MQEDDPKQFIKAMEVKLADHKLWNHWTLMFPIWNKDNYGCLVFKAQTVSRWDPKQA